VPALGSSPPTSKPGRLGDSNGAQCVSLRWRIRRRERYGLLEQEAAPVIETFDLELWKALRQLSRGQREAVALRVLLDLTTHEAAEVLGVAEGTVKTQLHRALGQLRDLLSEAKEVAR